MNMPGFTAEESLYQTNNHYRLGAGGGYLSSVSTTVTPQGCGLIKGAVCGGFIAGGTGLCTLTCLTGDPVLCAGCWVTALGAIYSSCKSCIPGWMRALIDAFESGGGAGSGGGRGGGPVRDPRRCCERSEFGRCIHSVPTKEACPGDDF
jgi:hypothetical protein